MSSQLHVGGKLSHSLMLARDRTISTCLRFTESLPFFISFFSMFRTELQWPECVIFWFLTSAPLVAPIRSTSPSFASTLSASGRRSSRKALQNKTMGKVKGDASKDIKAVKGGAVVKPKTPQKNEASPMRSPKPSPMGSPKRNQSPSARSNGSSVASPPSTPTGTASSRKPLPSSPSGGKPGKKLNVKITQPNKKEKTKTVLSQESSGSESDPTGPRVVSHKMSVLFENLKVLALPSFCILEFPACSERAGPDLRHSFFLEVWVSAILSN